VVNASLQFDAATLTPTYRFQKGVPGRSYGLAIARRLGVAPDILRDAEARVPDGERSLDQLLARVEERERELRTSRAALEGREVELDALGARLRVQAESQASREAELKRREKDAERAARTQARAFLLDARQRVEAALGSARAAADEVKAREARRMLEAGIVELAEPAEPVERTERETRLSVGDRVRIANGATGQVSEVRPDGTAVVVVGSVRVVVDAASVTPAPPDGRKTQPTRSAPAAGGPSAPSGLEVDLRGMTGDEAEMATVAAVDAAVLAEQPYLRIIHGMGTGVVRDRVRRVVAADRRVSRFEFAPRNQGGTGVTIVEFPA